MKTLKVVKIGGNIIDDAKERSLFLKEFAKITSPKILIHGGGKLASRLAEQMQVEVKMVDGRRITDTKTLDIVTMVYAGKINKSIVAELQSYQCNSVGFSGADGNSIVAKKRPVKEVDYGFVGDVCKVNIKVANLLIDNKVTPVFCAISHNKKGNLLNTNADTIASEIAIAFAKIMPVELYYCFEKKGVLKNILEEESVIKTIDKEGFQQLLSQGIIADGMLPKLKNCLYSVENGVKKVCVGQPNMLFKNEVCTTVQLKK